MRQKPRNLSRSRDSDHAPFGLTGYSWRGTYSWLNLFTKSAVSVKSVLKTGHGTQN